MTSISFLRRVLAADAASCAALGLLMSLGAEPLAPLLGLPHALILAVGLLLLPIAALVGWMASRPVPPNFLVWALIGGGLAWTLESFLLIGQNRGEITVLGTAFVTAEALAVLAFTALEYGALRKVRTSAAA